MTFDLSALPFDMKALEPDMSERTFEFHYLKHHKAYVDNLNKLVQGTKFENLSLEQIINETAEKTESAGIFNNAAQAWNHAFFWKSLKQNGGGKPKGEVLAAIEKAFGSYEKFREDFKTAATSQFGSGWAWLVKKNGKLEVMKTANADTPIAHGVQPLITLDVWEHAYYLDYQNRRPDFVDVYLDKLVNWEFAENNLGR